MSIRPSLLLLALLAGQPAARIALASEFEPPACDGSGPNDVDFLNPFCPWVQQFFLDQIGEGCGGGAYCPDLPVTRQQLAMLMEKAMRGTSTWDPARGVYVRTLIVHPVPGDPLASGAALLAARDSITGNSVTNPWLLKLEPGTYDLGNGSFVGLAYVDIEGSGEEVTTILAHGGNATVFGVGHEEFRFLALAHDGGAESVAIADQGGISLRHVSIAATNGGTASVGLSTAVNTRLFDVAIRAQGGSVRAVGIFASGSALKTLDRVQVVATGSTENYGVRAFGSMFAITSSNIAAAGGDSAIAFSDLGGSAVASLRDTTLESSNATATIGVEVNEAIDVVVIEQSRIRADTCVATANSMAKAHIAHTRLECPTLLSGGSVLCFGNYDAGLAPVTCP